MLFCVINLEQIEMKFTFKNLGAIDIAEVEIYPLTIICGRNNTGKTYVTYAIYAFLATWRQLIDWQVGAGNLNTLFDSGAVSIDLQKSFVDDWATIKEKTGVSWKKALPHALAAPVLRFKDTTLDFDFEIDNAWIERAYKQEFRSERGKLLFSAEKIAGSSQIELVALRDEETDELPRYALEDFVSQTILEAVLTPYIPNIFMVSTERTGAVAFKDELNLTKNRIVSLLSKMDSSKDHPNPGQLFEAVYKRGYPMPVENNVRYANSFGRLETKVSDLFNQHPELISDFENIAGGKYKTNKDGTTFFLPKGSNVELGLSEASSAVRSLVVLWYWLKAEAATGQMLLIDEPELNLHPENQRYLARFLAKLVNHGIRILITTHSDTMVREFNTLIMMSRQLPHVSKAKQSFGYAEDEGLSAGKVCLYVANGKERTPSGRAKKGANSTLEKFIPDTKIGLSANIFDSTIIEMNNIQDELRYGAE